MVYSSAGSKGLILKSNEDLSLCCIIKVIDSPPIFPGENHICTCRNMMTSCFEDEVKKDLPLLQVDFKDGEYLHEEKRIQAIAMREVNYSLEEAKEIASHIIDIDKAVMKKEFGLIIFIAVPHSWFKPGIKMTWNREGVLIATGSLKPQFERKIPSKVQLDDSFHAFMKAGNFR